MPTFLHRSCFPVPVNELYAWHLRPGAFDRLNPPWDPAKVLKRSGNLGEGDRVELQVRVGPFRKIWVAQHSDFIEGRQFRDVQLQGPFARWEHTHLFEPAGNDSSYLEDRIDYALPLGPLGNLLGGASVRRTLARVFAYRHRILMQDLLLHHQVKRSPQKILVSGAHGLVGSNLVPFLTTGGHEVSRLVRYKYGPDDREIFWDPPAGNLPMKSVEGFDAVIHLAGESIAAGRWTARRKKQILESRVQGTRLLCEKLAQASSPPRVLLCASAVGYYGDRGEEILDESSSPGKGFLAEVCQAWEAATQPAQERGIRVVHLRFGVVLSPRGGALAQMLPPFGLGLGGKIGSGKQFMSWIALDDVLGAIHHALFQESVHGPVNVVSPHPVTNAEFTRTLGSVLFRPTVFPMPAFVARLLLGEMAQDLLLASTRAQPGRLQQSGYRFFYPQLDQALRHLLGKIDPTPNAT